MASKTLTLDIETRARTGSTDAHAVRRVGKIPAVLYGHGTAPAHIAFDARAFDDLLHHGARHAIITLTVNGKKSETALLREIQLNPVSRKVQHVDLQRVSEGEAVHAKVPIVTTGVARGVRDFGGVMDVVVHEIEVEGPANAIPDHLDVDVTALGIHEHANASDVKLPKGFKLVTPADTIVVAIESSKTARQLEEAVSGVGEQAEPEIIREKPAEGE